MTTRPAPVLALGLALAACAWPLAAASDLESYGFVRTLEGRATLSGSSGRATAEINLPLATGDRIEVEPRSRLELYLSDRTLLRLDGESALDLDALAFSGDADARVTELSLHYGTAQLEVTDQALGDELARVSLGKAVAYVQDTGLYRFSTDGDEWAEVVVRRGYAEVATERGSVVVRSGEAAVIESRWAGVRVVAAPPIDGLERWAQRLDDGYGPGRQRYVDPGIAYAASSLDQYGSWISVSGNWAWRPNVSFEWRPYWNGRWCHTRSGLTWVSAEPWGWAPYHYGSWDMVPSYGWVWYPGRTYAPAWVYWYWGDGWAGWCPTGYYTRHYGRYGHDGLSAGLYGWAGGSWGLWAEWNFSPFHVLFEKGFGGHRRTGHDMGRYYGGQEMPRGLLTTDTRGIDPADLRPGIDARRLLRRNPEVASASLERLPDVTDFVARSRELSPGTRARVEGRDRGQTLSANPAVAIDGERRGSNTTGGSWRERDQEARERHPAIVIDGSSSESVAPRPRVRGGSDAVAAPRPAPVDSGDRSVNDDASQRPIDRGRQSRRTYPPVVIDRPAEESTAPTARREWKVEERPAPEVGHRGGSVGDRQGWRTQTPGGTTVRPPVERRELPASRPAPVDREGHETRYRVNEQPTWQRPDADSGYRVPTPRPSTGSRSDGTSDGEQARRVIDNWRQLPRPSESYRPPVVAPPVERPSSSEVPTWRPRETSRPAPEVRSLPSRPSWTPPPSSGGSSSRGSYPSAAPAPVVRAPQSSGSSDGGARVRSHGESKPDHDRD